MKNSKLFFNLSCSIPALLILCMVNLKAQNDLNGYTYLGFNGHFYYISNCETTWEEANAVAIEMGGYLSTISNYDENLYLQYGLEAYGVRYAWIGLRGENGIYEWANGETGSWTFWSISPVQEPVYADGAALMQDVFSFGAPNYDWGTAPISGEFKYIVEFPINPNCDNNPNKVYVCHNGNTICVNVTALQSHLDHGDLEGPCGPCNTYAMQTLPDDESEIEGQALQAAKVVLSEHQLENDVVQQISPTKQIQIFPNPASEEINVVLPEVNHKGTLRILSLTGQEIHTIPLHGQQSITLELSGYVAGFYLIDVQSPNSHYQKKFVKLH